MRANTVQPQAIEWLLHPFIPLGKLTVVAGQMGQANPSSRLAGRFHRSPRGGVIMLSAEDDPADTIRPRLEAVGADLARVEIAPDVMLDAARLAALCDELGDVKLITVDPIQAYIPATVNSWKGQDVRMALEPVRQLAADASHRVVLAQIRTADPTATRSRGSLTRQGVPQLARSVMIWGPDPQDPKATTAARKSLTRVKGNLARSSDRERDLRHHVKGVAGGHATAPPQPRPDVRDHRRRRDRRPRNPQRPRRSRRVAPQPARRRPRSRQGRTTPGPPDRNQRPHARPSEGGARVVSEPNRDNDTISGWTWSIPTYTTGTLDTVDTLGPLDKGAKKANKANNATHTNERKHSLTHPEPSLEDPAPRTLKASGAFPAKPSGDVVA